MLLGTSSAMDAFAGCSHGEVAGNNKDLQIKSELILNLPFLFPVPQIILLT